MWSRWRSRLGRCEIEVGKIDDPALLSVNVVSTVIGLAIDVSGSMRESFGAQAEQRLQAVWRSLQTAAHEAATVRTTDQEDRQLFGYLFGLQEGEVADLFAVSRLADLNAERIATASDLGDWYREAAKEFKRWELQLLASALDRRSECGRRLRELLPRKPTGTDLFSATVATFIAGKAAVNGSASKAIEYARGLARAEATWIMSEGERAIPLSDLAGSLRDGALDTTSMHDLVFGETPMVRALSLAAERFGRYPETRRRLVVISDGVPTDGDPLPVARSMRNAGVAILSCFIAPVDILPLRTFPTSTSHESDGAALMTAIASRSRDAPEVARAFRSLGWDCADDARLILQANHTRLLDELFTAALVR